MQYIGEINNEQMNLLLAQNIIEDSLKIKLLTLGEAAPSTLESFLLLADNFKRRGKYEDVSGYSSLFAINNNEYPAAAAAAGPAILGAKAAQKSLSKPESNKVILPPLGQEQVLDQTSLDANSMGNGSFVDIENDEKNTELSVIDINSVTAEWNPDGSYSSAIPILNRVIEARSRVFGSSDHISVLEAQGLLAGVMRLAGQLDKALSISESSLSPRRKLLGDNHEDVLQAVLNHVESLLFLSKIFPPTAKNAAEGNLLAVEASLANSSSSSSSSSSMAVNKLARAGPTLRDQLTSALGPDVWGTSISAALTDAKKDRLHAVGKKKKIIKPTGGYMGYAFPVQKKLKSLDENTVKKVYSY
jgi:hypothetical protein